MIFLERDRRTTKIKRNFRGQVPIDRVEALMKRRRDKLANGEDPKLDIDSKWAETKPQLQSETHQKCAYCESHSSAVAFGDVEHYRPKSIYWWLAYVYDNYLASCQICNQSWKSDNFEIDGVQLPAPRVTAQSTNAEIATLAADAIPDPTKKSQVRAFNAAHRRERPLNINPYVDKPERYFAWEPIVGTREVRLIHKPGARNARKIVDACERIYGLNRAPLVRRRYEHYEIYMASVVTATSAQVPTPVKNIHRSLIRSFEDAQSEYAGMVRYFEQQRKAGVQLPVPNFE